jgi:hypothetical protein
MSGSLLAAVGVRELDELVPGGRLPLIVRLSLIWVSAVDEGICHRFCVCRNQGVPISIPALSGGVDCGPRLAAAETRHGQFPHHYVRTNRRALVRKYLHQTRVVAAGFLTDIATSAGCSRQRQGYEASKHNRTKHGSPPVRGGGTMNIPGKSQTSVRWGTWFR